MCETFYIPKGQRCVAVINRNIENTITDINPSKYCKKLKDVVCYKSLTDRKY